MKTAYVLICLLVGVSGLSGQTIRERLDKAADRLQADPQMKHAMLAISVVKSETDEKIFEINAQTGLAPASCQKIITSAASFDILGPTYRYQTVLGYDGSIVDGILKGNLYLIGSGDPSLGSWRFDSTREGAMLEHWVSTLKQKGIRRINGNLIAYTGKWAQETLPDGWIWEDIGNYYGAGASALNWRENQYDLILKSGPAVGDKATIVAMKPEPYGITMESRLLSGPKGSGDNAYIYLPPFTTSGYVKGTIPADEKTFIISGSFPNPALQTLATLNEKLTSSGIRPGSFYVLADGPVPAYTPLHIQYSPPFYDMNNWFMKKSINLYGESLVKTIAYEKTGLGSTEKGVEQVVKFWKERGIEPSALHIIDGSGLSPQNRVTTDALVKVLQYARSRLWFRYYYDALPEFNQMKLKSGTIGGAKSFAGYHTAKDGTTYTVAVIVNNYDGSAGEIVRKMFRVLDELK